jgi:hypothetical protein
MGAQWPLPADISGFVGRSSESAQLAALLETGRLVTVTGPGGVGKTRRTADGTWRDTWPYP